MYCCNCKTLFWPFKVSGTKKFSQKKEEFDTSPLRVDFPEFSFLSERKPRPFVREISLAAFSVMNEPSQKADTGFHQKNLEKRRFQKSFHRLHLSALRARSLSLYCSA
jgi:hypothetical protein